MPSHAAHYRSPIPIPQPESTFMTLTEALAAASDERVSFFRYVPHRRIEAYRFCGWVVVDERPTHHSHYGVMMRFTKPIDGEPPEPARGARPRLKVAPVLSIRTRPR